jgi:hypothetical protein
MTVISTIGYGNTLFTKDYEYLMIITLILLTVIVIPT